jgi:ADP-L-glycero-D-manno-heptose 6-epimerase
VYGGSEAPFVEGRGEKPLNVYGESKLRLDEAVREMIEDGCSRIVGLRYSNVFGPGESHKGAMTSMVYKFGRQISSKERPSLFSWGGQKRDFIYVDDVVEANLCAARAEGSHIVNCGSGVATRFNTVVGEVQRVYSRPGPFAYMPENPYKATFQDHTECDTSLAERTIGFRAKISVREGIAKYHESGALTAA